MTRRHRWRISSISRCSLSLSRQWCMAWLLGIDDVAGAAGLYKTERVRHARAHVRGSRRPVRIRLQHRTDQRGVREIVRLGMMILTDRARNTATAASKRMNGSSEREGKTHTDRAAPHARGDGCGKKDWHPGPSCWRKGSGGCIGADDADESRV
jgi:hypothetical protein